MNPLFPVLEHDSSRENAQCLFPAHRKSESNDNKQDKEPDWLHNSSFKPDIRDVSRQTSAGTEEENQEREAQSLDKQIDCQTEDDGLSSNSEIKDNLWTSQRKKPRRRASSDSDCEVTKKKHKKTKHQKHKKHKKRSSSKSAAEAACPEINKVSLSSNKVFLEEIPGLEVKDAFRIHRKPDKNTYIYGSLYKMHVAKYKSHFNNCLSSDFKVQVAMKKSSKREKCSDLRYYDKEGRRILRSIPEQKITAKKREVMVHTGKEFIEISKSEKSTCSDTGEKKTVDIRDQLLDQKTKSYIHGNGSKKHEDSESLEDNSFKNSELWQMTADFNRKTREDPRNVQAWLEFVSFQDRFEYEELVDDKFSEGHSQKKLPKQIITDKKILILQKAMRSNPDCLILKMKYLELCQDNLDPSKVMEEMKSLLTDNPTSIALWKQFLMFGQSRLSVFSVSRTTQLYRECFQTLLSNHQGDLPKVSDTELLDIFVQYCYFLHQAGHREKAVACFQALLEFNIFCPLSLKNSNKGDKCAVFESFWDSGVARIGENGAKGWDFWIGNKDTPPDLTEMLADEADCEELEIIHSGKCRETMWLQLEHLRESQHWLPWRPNLSKNETEEDCEDMDRLVLFDDISPFIFSLSNSEVKFDLVLQFLQFLGVSVNDRFIPLTVKSLRTQLNVDRLSQASLRTDIFDKFELQETDGRSSPIRKTFIDSVFLQLTEASVFDSSFKAILVTLWFNFQTSQDIAVPADLKKIKKFAKNLLKEAHNRNNLYVWSEYVNQLRWLGGLKEARTVAETAFSLQSGSTEQDSFSRCGFVKLYRIYVEIILGIPDQKQCRNLNNRSQGSISTDQVTQALQCFICFSEGSNFKDKSQIEVGTTKTLKASHKLGEICKDLLQELSINSAGNSDNIPVFSFEYLCEMTKCYALCSWCISRELHTFVSVLDKMSSSVQQCLYLEESANRDCTCLSYIRLSSVLEEICKFKTQFILYLMSVNPLPLQHLRDSITQALENFSDNPFFLGVFVDMEQRAYIAGRLDRYFNSILKTDVSPVTVTYGVYTLIRRLCMVEHTLCQTFDQNINHGQDQADVPLLEVSGSESGMMHKVRSYLERALSHQGIQHCPLVWRLYLYTEMKYGNRERGRGIFFRALQQCPWAKVLYLDGVAVFGEGKLEDITDLLLEKELRLQLPLEELDILLEKQ